MGRRTVRSDSTDPRANPGTSLETLMEANPRRLSNRVLMTATLALAAIAGGTPREEADPLDPERGPNPDNEHLDVSDAALRRWAQSAGRSEPSPTDKARMDAALLRRLNRNRGRLGLSKLDALPIDPSSEAALRERHAERVEAAFEAGPAVDVPPEAVGIPEEPRRVRGSYRVTEVGSAGSGVVLTRIGDEG